AFISKNNKENKKIRLSMATFKRGINELEKASIIAKTLRKGRYYINPNFVFNGDRIAFTNLIERKAKDK
ncbi:replication/maintenance protein RepL, partial [Escherichia coli]|nr:replication/maintenance protein RepL [Escherichia coli]